jgi:hypothetical protein
MECGCVFCEFAKRKLATRKDKIKIIKSLQLALSSVVRRDARCLLATKLFNKHPLAILNGTSNPIGLHKEHSLFQRIWIHLHYDVKACKHLASLLKTD